MSLEQSILDGRQIPDMSDMLSFMVCKVDFEQKKTCNKFSIWQIATAFSCSWHTQFVNERYDRMEECVNIWVESIKN